MILPASPAAFARARAVLERGGLVALPTETVYGLAADARDPAAVASIFALKGRPATNPLITHLPEPGWAEAFGEMNAHAQALAGRFWPGPLTLVVDRLPEAGFTDMVSAGLPTVALRCPDAPWRAHIPLPLAMPSANRSGHVSPTTAEHVAEEFGDGLLVIDGGPCRGGLESTVVRVSKGGAAVLRPGTVTEEEIARLAPPIEVEGVGSPGLRLKHYAPAKPLRLEAVEAREAEHLIGFGGVEGASTLSKTGDLQEAARNLYAALRAADADASATAIAVAPVPERGVGRAIGDRLRRAARGR